MSEQVIVGGMYRHYKGDLYFVEDVALESTNGRPRERVVVYRGTKGLNVRLESQFLEFLPDKNQRRFEFANTPATGVGSFTQDELLAMPMSVKRKIAHIRQELARLQDAWWQDETIAPNGELRATVSRTVNRAAELQALVHRIHAMTDPNAVPHA